MPADSGHPLADLHVVAVAEADIGQILRIDLHHRDIGLRVEAENLAAELTVIGETHRDFVSAVHNVGVRQNEAVGADDEAGTRAALLRNGAFTVAAEDRETEALQNFRLIRGQIAERAVHLFLMGLLRHRDVDDRFAVVIHENGEVRQLRLIDNRSGRSVLNRSALGISRVDTAGKRCCNCRRHQGRLDKFGRNHLKIS